MPCSAQTFTHHYTGTIIFLQAIFLIMCSTVLSLPLRAETIDDKHRKTFETGNWDETGTPISLNVTRGLKSKRVLSSEYIPQNTDFVSQGLRIKRSKNGAKRGVDIGVKIKVPPTPKYDRKLDKLEEILELAKFKLEDNLEKVLNASACPSCDEEEEKKPYVANQRIKPAYKCDEWDARYRLCILERNIGDTVTFYLSTGKSEEHKLMVKWEKQFHRRDSKDRERFPIDPGNTPDNIIIGKQGYELRISPITEIDIGYNLFSASLLQHHSAQSTVYFMIRIVPIDLGFVYVGETIELNLRSYLSFPAESFSFRWYMEKYGEHSTLPSNMMTSTSGSSIKISELRQEQEGVLACTIYTNRFFLATKKRFLIKDLVKNNDVLKSPPNHTLHFQEENPLRRKRLPNIFTRRVRDVNAKDIEKALMDFTEEETRTTESENLNTTIHSYNDYPVEMGDGYLESPVQSEENFRRVMGNGVNRESLLHPGSISFQNNPTGFEGTGINSQVAQKFKDQNINEMYSDSSFTNGPKSDKTSNPFNQYSKQQIANTMNKEVSFQNDLDRNPELSAAQQPFLLKDIDMNGKNLLDIEDKNKIEKEDSPVEDSDVILTIEKIRRARQITAEEKISKLISFCLNDLQCSGAATCIKSNLELASYCKCFPGFYGVGIFCREDLRTDNKNFDVENLRNPIDVPYFSTLPTIEKR